MMQSKYFLFAGSLALALPFACSNSDDNASPRGSGGGKGSGGGVASGGDSQTGGSSASGSSTSSGGASVSAGGNSNSGGAPGAGGSDLNLGGMGGGLGNDDAFIPQGIVLTNLNGLGTGIDLIASTFVNTKSGPEFYAVAKNVGPRSGCSGAFLVDFYDHEGEPLGAWAKGLFAAQIYRNTDGTGSPVACVDKGEIGAVALTDLPSDLTVEDVGEIVYKFSYFNRDGLPFDVEPAEIFKLGPLEEVDDGTNPGFSFAGAFENILDVPMKMPSVTIFSLDSEGRPLSVARADAAMDLSAGDIWNYQTSNVDDFGSTQLVFPAADISF